MIYWHEDIEQIKEEFTKSLPNICDWFEDNKLGIHFRGYKTKKKQKNKVGALDIDYDEIKIKR